MILKSLSKKKEPKPKTQASGSAKQAETLLGKYFTGKIILKSKPKGGELIFRYNTEKQLEDFLKVLKEHNLQ